MNEKKPVLHTESEEKSTLQMHRTKLGKKAAFKVQQTIKFRIEEFEALMKSTEPGERELWSEGVSPELVPRAVWKLRVDPNGWKEKHRGNISVFLYLTGPMKDNRETLDVTYRIYLLDGSQDRKIDVVGRRTRNFGNESYSWGWHASHDELKKALQSDGSLLVAADVEFLVPYDSKVKEIFEGCAPSGDERDLFTKWQSSVSKLRETGDHSDCTLMVGDEQLKAHCLILSAISPIFGKMFGNEGFQEARDGIVRIEDPPGMLKDSTAKPYQALLSYAYTGCVDWTIYGDCKRDVLVVACKYLVFDLKHHVEKLLINEITAESFTELALLADTYSCDQLNKACVKFLSSDYAAMVLTPHWRDLMKTRVDLACELLRLVSEGKANASTTAAATDEGTK